MRSSRTTTSTEKNSPSRRDGGAATASTSSVDNRFLFRAALTFSYVAFPDFCGALGGYAAGQQYSGCVQTSRSAQCANHPPIKDVEIPYDLCVYEITLKGM